jgi:hypothetical protein
MLEQVQYSLEIRSGTKSVLIPGKDLDHVLDLLESAVRVLQSKGWYRSYIMDGYRHPEHDLTCSCRIQRKLISAEATVQ